MGLAEAGLKAVGEMVVKWVVLEVVVVMVVVLRGGNVDGYEWVGQGCNTVPAGQSMASKVSSRITMPRTLSGL